MDANALWETLRTEATAAAAKEPALAGLMNDFVLEPDSFCEALSLRLSRKLAYHTAPEGYLREVFQETFNRAPHILNEVTADILAFKERDPACRNYLSPLLYFKGFQALTCYRIAHQLWKHNREELALYLQSLVNEIFSVDIHPAASIGCGLLLDHATSFVVGETALIENNVSILHEVTLGGTGKEKGDRHPKVREGVLIGAGAKLLGNIEIGVGAKIGAGSVVLNDIPAHATAVGVPAKIVGRTKEEQPFRSMDHRL